MMSLRIIVVLRLRNSPLLFSFTCLQVNHLADIDEIPVPVEDGQGKKVRCAVVSTTVLPNFLSS